MKQIPCSACSARASGVFCHLSPADQALCDSNKTSNLYKIGQVLFYEGNKPAGIFCVFSGKIKLYKTGANGRLQIVRLAGPGDLLGYRSLIAGEAYSATAEVIEEAIVCFVDKTTFFDILRRNPQLALEMMKKLCRELRTAEDHVLDVAQKSTRERLAALLLTLQEAYGTPSNGGIEIGISLTREEMAEMIGTTQETVIRLLSELRSQGVVDVDGRTITILQSDSLRSIMS